METEYIVEKEFTYKGYDCLVIGYNIGHRCGYVRLPEGHKYYKKHYDDIPVDVHGGLTFSEDIDDELAERFERFPKGYWIGFDCAHLGDAQDEQLMSQGLKETYSRIGFGSGHIWSTSDVEEECKKVVEQLDGE